MDRYDVVDDTIALMGNLINFSKLNVYSFWLLFI